MASFVADLIRPRDLLDVQIEFVHLTLDVSSPGRPRIRRSGTGQAVVVLRLPPQHIAEEVTGGNPAPRLPYQARLACPSRIAFKMPDETVDIPFNAEEILRMLSDWEPLVANPLSPSAPATAIEFPDRLLIVPDAAARFFHGAAPATSAQTKRTAIWHARIRTSAKEAETRFRAVKNITDLEDRPFETTLKQRHREDIVKRSMNASDQHVIAASRFMLTALGASATLRSAWPPDDGNLQAWDHDAEAGRDLYVRTAEKGYLFPFGHRATLVKITRRQFEQHVPLTIAELVQEQILLIQEEERDYRKLAQAFPFGAREMPLKTVRLAQRPLTIANERDPVVYPAIVTDAEENEIACNLSVLFMPAGETASEAALARLRRAYEAVREVDLASQNVVLAEDPERVGDANLIVMKLNVGVKIGNELRARVTPPFLPVMESAAIKVPALEQLLATVPDAGVPPAVVINLHQNYLREGFRSGDKKRVFATFPPMPGINIPAERAGGIAAPRFPDVDGLSKTMGPVSGVQDFAAGTPITAEQLIGDAKLLGVIALKELIGRIESAADTFSAEQLAALYDRIDAPGESINLTRPVLTTAKRGDTLETRFLWKPKLDQGNFPPILKRGASDVELILKGRITKSIASVSAAPGFEVEGKLRSFNLEFAGLMSLEFNALEFKSGGGRKLDVNVDLKAFNFLGALRFVEEIRNLIPLKSLAGSPILRPQPDGVVIGYALPIPAVPLGIFNIQNIALVSSVSIPFVEGKSVAVRFSLSERSNPFLVSASIFGGTGFFAVEVRTDGLVRVEAAIEFGGLIALDLVIVKGAIYLLAGIYVAMDTDGKALISGYLRFGGYVDVLEMVSASIEFYIALTYDASRNVLFGEGRVTVSVKVLFFSESFGFTVRKEVPGFGQAPGEQPVLASHSLPITAAFPMARAPASVGPAMSLQQWQKYCAAFA